MYGCEISAGFMCEVELCTMFEPWIVLAHYGLSFLFWTNGRYINVPLQEFFFVDKNCTKDDDVSTWYIV